MDIAAAPTPIQKATPHAQAAEDAQGSNARAFSASPQNRTRKHSDQKDDIIRGLMGTLEKARDMALKQEQEISRMREREEASAENAGEREPHSASVATSSPNLLSSPAFLPPPAAAQMRPATTPPVGSPGYPVTPGWEGRGERYGERYAYGPTTSLASTRSVANRHAPSHPHASHTSPPPTVLMQRRGGGTHMYNMHCQPCLNSAAATLSPFSPFGEGQSFGRGRGALERGGEGGGNALPLQHLMGAMDALQRRHVQVEAEAEADKQRLATQLRETQAKLEAAERAAVALQAASDREREREELQKREREEAATKREREELQKREREEAAAKREREEAAAKREREVLQKREKEEAAAKREREEAAAKREKEELQKREKEEAAAKRQREERVASGVAKASNSVSSGQGMKDVLREGLEHLLAQLDTQLQQRQQQQVGRRRRETHQWEKRETRASPETPLTAHQNAYRSVGRAGRIAGLGGCEATARAVQKAMAPARALLGEALRRAQRNAKRRGRDFNKPPSDGGGAERRVFPSTTRSLLEGLLGELTKLEGFFLDTMRAQQQQGQGQAEAVTSLSASTATAASRVSGGVGGEWEAKWAAGWEGSGGVRMDREQRMRAVAAQARQVAQASNRNASEAARWRHECALLRLELQRREAEAAVAAVAAGEASGSALLDGADSWSFLDSSAILAGLPAAPAETCSEASRGRRREAPAKLLQAEAEEEADVEAKGRIDAQLDSVARTFDDFMHLVDGRQASPAVRPAAATTGPRPSAV